MTRSIALIIALAAASIANSAYASEGNGFFVRAEAGSTELKHIDSNYYPYGTKLFDSARTTEYSLRSGYFFNANWAVEGFVGRASDTTHRLPGPYSARYASSNYGAGIVGKKNFGDAHQGFFVGGRAGIAVANDTIEYRFTPTGAGTGSTATTRNIDTNFYFGASAGYDFSKHVGLSLNVDQQRRDIAEHPVRITTTSLALEYRF